MVAAGFLLAFMVPASAQSGLEGPLGAAPLDGGARHLIVTSETIDAYPAPSAAVQSDLKFAKGAVLSNLGCSPLGEALWCHIKPLRGGAKSYVPAEFLEPAKGPDGVIATGPDDSKKRARKRDFDAVGDIACAQEKGQSLGTCKIAAARSGGGDATLVVTFPNGFARDLYFRHGEFMRAGATMSGVGTDMDWSLSGGIYEVRVDDQRFEIPVALVIGE